MAKSKLSYDEALAILTGQPTPSEQLRRVATYASGIDRGSSSAKDVQHHLDEAQTDMRMMLFALAKRRIGISVDSTELVEKVEREMLNSQKLEDASIPELIRLHRVISKNLRESTELMKDMAFAPKAVASFVDARSIEINFGDAETIEAPIREKLRQLVTSLLDEASGNKTVIHGATGHPEIGTSSDDGGQKVPSKKAYKKSGGK
jgi:hypothetical protein